MIPADWVTRLAETVLGNAISVTVLAAGVFLVGRWIRSPAVRHALWAVVLVRALMPPVISVPTLPADTLTWFTGPAVESTEPFSGEGSGKIFGPSPLAPGPLDLAVPGASIPGAPPPHAEGLSESVPGPRRNAGARPPAATSGSDSHRAATASSGSSRLGLVLGIGWALGAFGALGLAVWRLYRFRHALGTLAPVDPGLHRRSETLARQLGLSRCPPILLTTRRVPPLVWAPLGRPCIVLPRALVERLSSAERETVLAHELAHIARRDHWLRALELVAGVLFWWHPVVAWSRRRLRECEEEACDQKVLSLLPHRAQAYAEAVLETLDLTARPPAEPGLPAMASGLQPRNRTLQHLEGRLQMILHSKTSRPLPWHLRLALALAATLALLVLPTRSLEAGGEGVEPDSEAQAVEEARDLERAQLELEEQALELETEARRAELERLREDTQRSRLRQTLRVRELEARLEHARETADANAELELVAELEAARAQHEIDEREWQLEMERIQTELDLERRMHVLELDTRRRVLDEGPIDREEVEARRRQMITEMLENRQRLSEREHSARTLVMKAEREQMSALRRRLEGRSEMAEALARREAEMARQHEETSRQMELQRLQVEAELERHRLEQEVEAGRMTREQAEATFEGHEAELQARQQDLVRYHIERQIEDLQRELPSQIAVMRRQLEESGATDSELADSLQALRHALEETLRSID